MEHLLSSRRCHVRVGEGRELLKGGPAGAPGGVSRGIGRGCGRWSRGGVRPTSLLQAGLPGRIREPQRPPSSMASPSGRRHPTFAWFACLLLDSSTGGRSHRSWEAPDPQAVTGPREASIAANGKVGGLRTNFHPHLHPACSCFSDEGQGGLVLLSRGQIGSTGMCPNSLCRAALGTQAQGWPPRCSRLEETDTP